MQKIQATNITVQKIKFSIKDFFNECDQTHRKLRIWSLLLMKSLMKNFIFGAVYISSGDTDDYKILESGWTRALYPTTCEAEFCPFQGQQEFIWKIHFYHFFHFQISIAVQNFRKKTKEKIPRKTVSRRTQVQTDKHQFIGLSLPGFNNKRSLRGHSSSKYAYLIRIYVHVRMRGQEISLFQKIVRIYYMNDSLMDFIRQVKLGQILSFLGPRNFTRV